MTANIEAITSFNYQEMPMRYLFICSCLLLGLLTATSVQAESFRATEKKSAKSDLEFYSVFVDKLKKGERICGTGIQSTWGTMVARVSDTAISNGLRPGDQLLELNGTEITETNRVVVFSNYRPGDQLRLTIDRNEEQIVLDFICNDGTEKFQAVINMLKAKAKGRWQDCIDYSNKADNLIGDRISYVAVNRLNCNEAKRCGFGGCRNPTNRDAQLSYDYRLLVLQEAIIVGGLDEVRADILSGITWLEQSGFRRLANDLDSRVRAAEPTPSRSIARSNVPSEQVTAYGTCFAVSPTEVLTSHHVVADASIVTVQFQDGSEFGAVVDRHSRATDLALLKINGLTPASLQLAASRSLSVGDLVFTLGFPATSILGDDAKFTEGSVSALSGIQGDASYFQMSVPVQPGNSGGPVVNMQGEAVGVVAATAAIEAFYAATGALPQNVNWASKSDYARLLFDPPINSKTAKDRDEAIRMVRSAVCKVTAIKN